MAITCKDCGIVNGFIEEKGTQVGLYCNKCGKWIKWLGKNETRLFKYYDTRDKEIYNKAIDDFVEKIKLKYLGVHPDELHTPHYAYDIVEDIKNISEQLKEGEKND